MPTPAPVIVDEVLEIIINGSMAAGGSNATRAGNVFYYRKSLNTIATNKANVSAMFQTTVGVPLLAATNTRYSPVSCTIRKLSDATDPPVVFTFAGTGAIATDSEPSDDAAVVYMKNNFRGKVFRGFKHFGGTNEVDTTADVLTGAGLTRWQAVRDACKAPFVDADGNRWTPMIFSRFQSSVKVNPTTVRGSDCTIALLDLTIGTMRRRKAKTVR